MKRKDGRAKNVTAEIPPFTRSVDAKVPSENVVISHFVTEAGKWFAASEGSDGKIHTGFGNTEPLARRIAGLRTFQHLEARAAGTLVDLTPEEIEAARAELATELTNLEKAILGHNEAFPASLPQQVVLIQVRAARDLVVAKADRRTLAKWVAPPLLFLAGGFANGILGVIAEKALALLQKLLAN